MPDFSLDGVPVFVADGPAPLSAGLVFGVGRRNESFVRGGLTHLVEHLAMSAVGRLPFEVNACVSLSTTEFTATGPPHLVADFLRTVCLALADLPVDRLAVEVDVLRTECAGAGGSATEALLGTLYGLSGVGLASLPEPALRSFSAADVRDWAGRWFIRQNAALWVTGPLPEGAALPLPDGVPPVRDMAQRAAVRTPAWEDVPMRDLVLLGAEVPRRPAVTSAMAVLRDRVEEELRHRRGLAYTVQTDRIPVDSDTCLVTLGTDVRSGQDDVVASVLWRETLRLAEEGPSEAELEHERASLEILLSDPRAAVGQVQALAEAHVTGMVPVTFGELREAARTLTVDAVRDAATALRDGALLLVPEDVPGPTGVERVPLWAPDAVAGREFARRRGGSAPKGAVLVVGEDGVSIVLDADRRVTVRWQDTVGLVRTAADSWLVFGRDGTRFPLTVDDWRDGPTALAMVRAAIADDLQVVDDDAEEGGGLLLYRAPAHKVLEAVAFTRTPTATSANREWTAVVVDREQTAQARAEELAVHLKRGTVALLLRRGHADLEYVLLRGEQELDRHRWGVVQGDPQLLAEMTGRPADALTELLADRSGPDEVLARLVALLGLPSEVPELLDREAGRARRPGSPAAVEHPAATTPVSSADLRALVAEAISELPPGLATRRPRWYRALNGAGAVLCVLALLVLLAPPRSVDGMSLVAMVVLCAAGLFTCLSRVRKPVGERDPATRDPADLTPIG